MKPFLKLTVCICLLLSGATTFAQQKTSGTIKGIIVDSKNNKPIDYASYAVKNVKDSTVSSMGVTNPEGVFSAKNLPFGQYKFYAAFIGYKPVIKLFELTAEKTSVDFGSVGLEETGISINDVVIKGELLPMLIKKDTIEFNADAFKTQADANVDDLLKTMPGMEFDKDGNITFNGKKIDKVLVDGKEFFGNDVKMATQNLPKDIVNKIQVIEKKTDDAIFKGIDNGKRENVLNIDLKKDKKKGYFGNVSVGKGGSDLYESSLNINRFTGKHQISLVGSSNNINRSAGIPFDVPMGASISVFGGGGGGSRINSSQTGALNYNGEWGQFPKFQNKAYVSYNYNRNYNLNQNISSRLNLLGEDSYFNDRTTESTIRTARHTFYSRLEFVLDTNTKIMIRPNISLSDNNSSSMSDFSSYKQVDNLNINKGNSNNSNSRSTPTFSGTLIFNQKLSKPGRRYSISANGSTTNAETDGLNGSTIIINNNGAPATTIINQLTNQVGDNKSYGFEADYSEPLGKNVDFTVGYEFNKRKELVKRAVYDYNTGSTQYDILNTDLSRQLDNYNATSSVSANFNYSPEKWNLNIDASQDYVKIYGLNLLSNTLTSKNYILFEPSFRISWKPSKVSNLSLSGGRYNNVPDVSQIQAIVDNSNPLNIISGNPNLRPGSNNNASLSYNRFGPNSGSNINLTIGGGNSENQIMNNTVYNDKTGIQTTVYDNLSGSYSYYVRLGGSLRFKSLGLTISPNVGLNNNKNYSFFNNQVVNSRSRSFNIGSSLSYSIGSALQLLNFFSMNIRKMKYDYNNLPDNTFKSVSNTLNLVTTLPNDLRFALNSSIYYNANLGINGVDNEPQHTAGASIEKLFLKKAAGFKISVSDIFNNSKNVNRQVSDTYIVENINIGMRRYFFMALTYKLKKFGT